MSTLYYPYWRQDHSYVQMDATTPVQHFWVNNADKNFVVTYIANTRTARVKCRICGMVWVRNSIIMLNVIYAEWFKEINSTVKRARQSHPENGACSTGLKTPISVLVSISTCRCLAPYSRIEDHFKRRMMKIPEQGATDCRVNVGKVTTVVSVFRNLICNWG